MLVPVWLALTSLAVGETCPAAADVETRVRTILHLPAERELSESFLVERHEAGLYVELRAADSTLIGQRTLPLTRGATCDELSQASAVVLSAWLSDVHPDFAGALPTPEHEPEPAPEPKAAEEPKPAPEPPPPSKKAEVATSAPPSESAVAAHPRHYRLELEAALGVDVASSSVTLALPAGVGYQAVTSGLGIQGFLCASFSHELALAPGQVVWRRWPIGAGPSYRFRSGDVAWDVGAGGLIGWLHLTGKNFDHVLVKDGATVGGYVAAQVGSRLAQSRHHWGLYGTVIAQVFPGQVDLSVNGLTNQVRLPVFSVGLGLGARLAP